MIGSLFDYWKYTWPDVWSLLGRSAKTPPDLFIELYRTASDFFQTEPSYEEFELATNDPEEAKKSFERIEASDFGSETSILRFMESAFEAVTDLDAPAFPRLYRWLVKGFIQKYNLRYRVDEPFRFRLVLPAVFADFYDTLCRLNHADPHLNGLMSDFEQTFGAYARSKQACDLTAVIGRASIYAEGLAARTCGQAGTLGALSDGLTYWPHVTVKESLKKLYGFCSDYPRIRHAGNPSSALRELDPRDAVVICLLLMSFSGYLTNDVGVENILGL